MNTIRSPAPHGFPQQTVQDIKGTSTRGAPMQVGKAHPRRWAPSPNLLQATCADLNTRVRQPCPVRLRARGEAHWDMLAASKKQPNHALLDNDPMLTATLDGRGRQAHSPMQPCGSKFTERYGQTTVAAIGTIHAPVGGAPIAPAAKQASASTSIELVNGSSTTLLTS